MRKTGIIVISVLIMGLLLGVRYKYAFADDITIKTLAPKGPWVNSTVTGHTSDIYAPSTLPAPAGGNGNVGIGTTNPASALTIVRETGNAGLAIGTPATDTNVDARIMLNTLDTDKNGGIGAGEKGWRIIARANNYGTANLQNDLQIYRVYGNPQVSQLTMHFNSEDSHVGIGQDTTPDAMLSVRGETNDVSTTALNITKNNGSSILCVKNNGAVGIGTTSISGLLEICSKDGTLQLMLSDERAGIPAAHKQRAIRLYEGKLFFNKHTGSGVTTQMVIENDGNVGIGMDNPAHPLHMASGAHCTAAGAWKDASDISHKKNIVDLGYGLNEILKLQPREYDMKLDGLHQVGFVGQEVEKVIPEVVSGKEGDKGIGYGGITAVLVNAVKEQQQQIDSQQKQIEELKKSLAAKPKDK